MYRMLVLDIPLDGETIRILIDTKLHSGILWVQFCIKIIDYDTVSDIRMILQKQ